MASDLTVRRVKSSTKSMATDLKTDLDAINLGTTKLTKALSYTITSDCILCVYIYDST